MRTSTVSSALCRAFSASALALVAACSFSPGAPAMGGQGSGTDGGLDARVDGSAVDGGMVDASPDGPPSWDPTMCPVEYTGVLAGSPASRYRVISTTDDVGVQHDDCNDDHAGWTHLVVLDAATEGDQIRASLITSNAFYVGAVQTSDANAVDAGWLGFTGAPVPAAVWQTGQPNDNGDDVEDNEQNFAVADDTGSGLLNDVSGSASHRAVCECDGKPIPAAVASAFAASAP